MSKGKPPNLADMVAYIPVRCFGVVCHWLYRTHIGIISLLLLLLLLLLLCLQLVKFPRTKTSDILKANAGMARGPDLRRSQ